MELIFKQSMTTTLLSILFIATMIMTLGVVSSVDFVGNAEALKASGVGINKYGQNTKNLVCGDKLCSEVEEQAPVEKAPAPKAPAKETPKAQSPPKMEQKPEMKQEMKQEMKKEMHQMHSWKSTTATVTSSQDPGLGHESHQLAVLLPPSDKIYKGMVSYSASEPIQLVALHGPLKSGEDKGQPIWTPDGKTKFALTLVDQKTAMGSWLFTGNALAVHTMNENPFTVSYSTSYMENEKSDTITSGTMTSMQDPGVGHEGHQLAIILPPSDKAYSGIVTYTASEPIQLIALHGPLKDGEDKGQPIWTPDGKTKFALTLVDNEANMGTWKFAGNALAVHTKNTTPFTVSYSVVAGQ